MTWRPISQAKEFRTYLTRHYEDLHPVCACRIDDEWLRVTEGPEDDFDGRGWYEPLYRTPTHFMDLDELPFLPPPPKETET